MRNIHAFSVTAQLQLIKSKSQLSNSVSAQALAAASAAWAHYQSRYDHMRTNNMLVAIRRNLALIIAQVIGRVCRINPLMWSELHKLDAVLKYALEHGINLEPNPFPIAANDDNNLDEVSNA